MAERLMTIQWLIRWVRIAYPRTWRRSCTYQRCRRGGDRACVGPGESLPAWRGGRWRPV